MILEAEDDPIIPATAFAPLERKITSPYVIIAATATGGTSVCVCVCAVLGVCADRAGEATSASLRACSPSAR